MKEQFIQIIQTQAKHIGRVLGVIGAVTVYSFLLLMTSVGLHWWRPFWGVATERVTLIILIVFCIPYSLLYALRLWLKVRTYKKREYDYSVVQQLIVSVEVLAGFILWAVWGLRVLAGQPSILPIKLLAGVWIAGFVGLVVSRIYELRRQRRPNGSNSTRA